MTDKAMEEAQAIAEQFWLETTERARLAKAIATALASKDAEIERLTKERDERDEVASFNFLVADAITNYLLSSDLAVFTRLGSSPEDAAGNVIDSIKAVLARTEKAERALAEGVRVKALDFSTVLRHAFLSGVAAARSIPAHEECIGTDLWPQYEPYEPGAYSRILSALEPAAPEGAQNAMDGRQSPDRFEAFESEIEPGVWYVGDERVAFLRVEIGVGNPKHVAESAAAGLNATYNASPAPESGQAWTVRWWPEGIAYRDENEQAQFQPLASEGEQAVSATPPAPVVTEAQERAQRLANAAENFVTRFNMNDLSEDDDRQRQAVLDQIRLFRAALSKTEGA